jgi:hypothetical protein
MVKVEPAAGTRNHRLLRLARFCPGPLADLGQGHLSLFIMAGHTYTHRSQLPRGLLLVPSAGYDGQFYYRLALDPFNWHHTAFGITMDQSYRYTRIGYPSLAWIFSLGQHQLVPVVLVVLNLFAVAAMAMLGGVFARDAGRHALWGLAFVAYFGLVISVGRDTAEPVAEACMLGGLLAFRRGGTRMYLLATALFAYGAITGKPSCSPRPRSPSPG